MEDRCKIVVRFFCNRVISAKAMQQQQQLLPCHVETTTMTTSTMRLLIPFSLTPLLHASGRHSALLSRERCTCRSSCTGP